MHTNSSRNMLIRSCVIFQNISEAVVPTQSTNTHYYLHFLHPHVTLIINIIEGVKYASSMKFILRTKTPSLILKISLEHRKILSKHKIHVVLYFSFQYHAFQCIVERENALIRQKGVM